MEEIGFAERRADLVESIARDREQVRVAMDALSDPTGLTHALRERIRAYPLTWAIAALLIGALVGSRTPPAGSAGQRRPS